jgi:hypothetical protein
MRNNNDFKLIDGTYHPDEANILLTDLVQSKIKFHSQDAFSKRIRFNMDPSNSQKRIEELKQMQAAINMLLKEASNNGMSLQIRGTVELILVPAETPEPQFT